MKLTERWERILKDLSVLDVETRRAAKAMGSGLNTATLEEKVQMYRTQKMFQQVRSDILKARFDVEDAERIIPTIEVCLNCNQDM